MKKGKTQGIFAFTPDKIFKYYYWEVLLFCACSRRWEQVFLANTFEVDEINGHYQFNESKTLRFDPAEGSSAPADGFHRKGDAGMHAVGQIWS